MWVEYDGIEYRIDYEWWGPGCVFKGSYGEEAEFEAEFDWMSEDEREDLFREEVESRMKVLKYKNIVGYGWDHPDEPLDFNNYCSIGYIVRLEGKSRL